MDKYLKIFLIFIIILFILLYTFIFIKMKYDKYEIILNDDEHIIYSIKGSDKILIVPTNNREEKPYILDIKDTIKRKQEDFIITKHKESN